MECMHDESHISVCELHVFEGKCGFVHMYNSYCGFEMIYENKQYVLRCLLQRSTDMSFQFLWEHGICRNVDKLRPVTESFIWISVIRFTYYTGFDVSAFIKMGVPCCEH